MNKTITTALLILASGSIFSTTALAEPFNNGSSYTNAISNVYSSANTQSTRSIQRTETMVTASGFNDRGTVENVAVTVGPRTVVETSISRMFSNITSGFNDRS